MVNSPSYWVTTASNPPASEPLRENTVCDVAIIGGGFSGLSTALHLAEKNTRVVILESAELGAEASGRNNGQVIPTIKKEDPSLLIKRLGDVHGNNLVTMMQGAASYLFQLIEKHGIDCDAEQTGWIQPAHSQHHLAIAERRATQWQAYGAEVEILDSAETSKCLGSDFYCGGWRAKSGGHIQPLSYVRGLAEAVLKQGGEIYTQTPATEIIRRGNRWQVKTANGSVTADQVVIATNAATPRNLWQKLSQAVVPAKFYQLVSEPLTRAQRLSVIPGREAMSDMQGDIYFMRYDRFNRLVTGGSFIYEKNWQQRLNGITHRRLKQLFPELPALKLSHHWSGSVGMTPDFFPRLFSLAPGVWSWMGCNGRGISLSTSMGRVMADLVQGKPYNEMPLPVESLRTIPCHQLLTQLSLYALIYYRLEDLRYRHFG